MVLTSESLWTRTDPNPRRFLLQAATLVMRPIATTLRI